MTGEASWIDQALAPLPEDSADVRWALETAVAMWIRGDKNQALNWVHNAVQSASSEGRHDRAYALGQVAGQLEKRQTAGQRPPMPTAHVASTTQPTAGTAPLQPKTRSRKSLMQTAPYKIPPDEVTHLIEPEQHLLDACQPPEPQPNSITGLYQPDDIPGAPPPATAPVEEQSARPERPRPPTIIRDSLDATLTDVRPKAPVSKEAEHTVVMSAEELMPPSVAAVSPHPNTLGSAQAVLEPMRALRVVVQSGSGREIVVRLLSEGEAVPPGTQEALLLPLLGKPTK